MNEKEFEEFVRRNPQEAMRLIVKAFNEKELLRVGNRSYVNAFKYPESRFDLKDLMHNGGSLEVLKNPDMLQPLSDPGKLFTDKYVIPPSSLIFKWADKVYDKKWWGQVAGGLPDAAAVIQSALNDLTRGRTWKERVVLKGDFLLKNRPSIPSYTIFEVQGRLRADPSLTSSTVLLDDNVHDVEIIGGSWIGHSEEGVHIRIHESCHDILIRDAYFTGAKYALQSVTYVSRLTFKDCLIDSIAWNGVDAVLQDSLFINVVSRNAGRCGLLFGNAKRLRLIACAAEYAAEYGFVFEDGVEDVEVINCRAIGNGKHGLVVYWQDVPKRDFKVIGGLYAENGLDGVQLNGYTGKLFPRIEVIGVTSKDNGVKPGITHAIRLSNCEDAQVLANLCIETRTEGDRQDYAIRVSGVDIYVKNNIIVGDGWVTAKISGGTVVKHNIGYVTENSVLSDPFAIDSVGLKTITIPHGLDVTPNLQDIAISVVEETDVDDWEYSLLKVDSVDATNVVVKIYVSTASATAGATARIALRVGKP